MPGVSGDQGAILLDRCRSDPQIIIANQLTSGTQLPADCGVSLRHFTRDRSPNIELLQSTNLSSWNPSGITPTISPVDSDWNEWTYEIIPAPDWERLFLRLQVIE